MLFLAEMPNPAGGPRLANRDTLVQTEKPSPDFAVVTPLCKVVNQLNCRHVLAASERSLESGRCVLFDLRNVDFMDSAGLGSLVSASRTVQEAGGEFFVAGFTPAVRKLFEAVRLDRIIRVFNDRDEVMRAHGLAA